MYKIDYLKEFIVNFNKLSYNKQCDYIKNKLLSLDLYEIQFIMFFKKLHVFFNDYLVTSKILVKITKGIYTILRVY